VHDFSLDLCGIPVDLSPDAAPAPHLGLTDFRIDSELFCLNKSQVILMLYSKFCLEFGDFSSVSLFMRSEIY
jgi:hypothetical protein